MLRVPACHVPQNAVLTVLKAPKRSLQPKPTGFAGFRLEVCRVTSLTLSVRGDRGGQLGFYRFILNRLNLGTGFRD